jgi:hypothetical protein
LLELTVNRALVESRTEKYFSRRDFNICDIYLIFVVYEQTKAESIGKTV